MPSDRSQEKTAGRARPDGQLTKDNGQIPRFAILIHDHPFLHWDLLLEAGEVLRAWRLLAEPAADVSIVAEELPEHRPVYLDYEGPVSGERGTVVRWDTGEYSGEHDGAKLSLTLKGRRLKGNASLADYGREGWRFVYRPEA